MFLYQERFLTNTPNCCAMFNTEREPISNEGITIDFRQHRAYAGDVEIKLTPTEFRLLAAFVSEPGRAFSRAELVAAAIGDETIVSERTIDVHIRALRVKLGSYANRIETVRSVGYGLRAAEPQTTGAANRIPLSDS
jgi:two-component system phosphate regulon response regulator PhoB